MSAIPRCQHCGYALIRGQCPIPCGGKPLATQAALGACHAVCREPKHVAVYWSPTKPNEAGAWS
jgi:hypothetical protein